MAEGAVAASSKTATNMVDNLKQKAIDGTIAHQRKKCSSLNSGYQIMKNILRLFEVLSVVLLLCLTVGRCFLYESVGDKFRSPSPATGQVYQYDMKGNLLYLSRSDYIKFVSLDYGVPGMFIFIILLAFFRKKIEIGYIEFNKSVVGFNLNNIADTLGSGCYFHQGLNLNSIMSKRFLIMAGSLVGCYAISEITKNGLIGYAGPFVGVFLILLFGYRSKK